MKTSPARIPAAWFLMMVAITAGERLAVADDATYPKRKPGLWELTRSSPNPKYPPQVQQICLDEATDQMLYKIGAGASHSLCDKVDVRARNGTVVVDSVCSVSSTRATSHSVISFSGDTAYHEEISTHYEPPLLGKTQDAHSSQDGKWIGACSADMRPGDIIVQPSPIMPIPLRMNIRGLMQNGGTQP